MTMMRWVANVKFTGGSNHRHYEASDLNGSISVPHRSSRMNSLAAQFRTSLMHILEFWLEYAANILIRSMQAGSKPAAHLGKPEWDGSLLT